MYKAPDAFQEALRRFLAEGGYAWVDAPGGREADAERLVAVVEALTGKKPRIRRMKNGQVVIVCYEGHLEGFNALRRTLRRHREVAGGNEPVSPVHAPRPGVGLPSRAVRSGSGADFNIGLLISCVA